MKIYRIAAPLRTDIDWKNIDWSKTNKEIASVFNITPYTVQVYRLKYAPDGLKNRRKIIDWTKIDWTKTNQELCLEHGFIESQVGAARKKFAPETVHNDEKFSIILISHELQIVDRYATKVICLNKNKVCYGAPREVLINKNLSELFGGDISLYHHH